MYTTIVLLAIINVIVDSKAKTVLDMIEQLQSGEYQ